jgi:hypothetical protein
MFLLPWHIHTWNETQRLILVISNEGCLQGRVVHFLCRSIIFSRVVCVYMLLTWHKNNNFPNLWLDLDYQFEEEDIYKKIATYIHQIYSNGFLKLKNMNWFIVCASIHMHFCVWILFGIYYRDSIYVMLKQKEHMCKTIAKKKLWTFEWPKMSHIFISPYHNHFWVDFNFYFLNMYVKELFKIVILHMGFLVH